jgi:hypothetical protein
VAKRLAAVRAGKLSAPSVKGKATATPFTLALQGRPEVAILWKNLIMVGRYASLRMLIRLVPMVILFGLFATRRGNGGGVLTAVALICLVCLFVTVVLGPQMVRNDLRQDLANLAVLKTWPISGTALLRGELLAPAVTLSAIAWLFILGILMLTGRLPLDGGTAATVAIGRVSYAVAAALVAPGLILAQLVVQNGLAIMFPAWVTIGASRAQGVEATGQRLLMMAGNLLALVLSLLPGVIVGGGLALAVYATTGVVLVVLPALILGVTLLAESWLAVEALGRVLARTDVTAIGPVE